jgi:hypothetical protein
VNNLISFSPYLVLIYVVFAFIQAIRHQRQGLGAIILGIILTIVPLVAYVLSSEFAARNGIMNSIGIGTAALCLSCIGILLIERRDSKRDKKRSYGMFGIGMTVVLAGGLMVMSMTQTASPPAFTGQGVPNASNSPFVNISQPDGSNSTSNSTETTEVAKILTAQTGLAAADLTTQINNGSTISQLVAAHSGNIEAVKTAMASALDEIKAAGGMQAQMLSNFGSDSKDIATKIVDGLLPAQVQQMMTTQLISGSNALPQGNPPQNGSGGFVPPSNGDQSTNTAGNPNAAPPSQGNTGGFVPPANENSASTQATATPQNIQVAAVPTEVVVRPTLIVFPTATATLESTTATGTAQNTSIEATVESSTTCKVVVAYNLNLRDKPTTDESTVLLSIPYGTTVTTTGRTSDDWYKVDYQGQKGWVSGTYVSPQATCSQLATITG